MTTAQFKEKYEALQKEGKDIATELKIFAKRYRAFCKKASALGHKADNDEKLYRENKELGNNGPDGWNIHILFRLTDFDGAEDWVHDACNVLLNLTDEPFYRKARK